MSWVFITIMAIMILFAVALAKAAGKPMPQNAFKPRTERTETDKEEHHGQTNHQGRCGCNPAGNSLVQDQDVAAQPGAPVGKVTDTVTWVMICFLAIIAGFLVGSLAGFNITRLSEDHRYVKALAERHEAEARYWTSRLDETITENKGRHVRKEER